MFFSISSGCGMLYPSVPLDSCVHASHWLGKCFMRKLLVNNSCLWSRHGRKIFSFTSHVAGARGPPWGGERESLTSMCFSFVKHHTSTVWLTHALLYMIYAVSSCDRWVICKVGKAPEVCERLELWVRLCPEQLLKMNPERNFMTLHTACESVNRTNTHGFLAECQRCLLFWINILGLKPVKLIGQTIMITTNNYFDFPSLFYFFKTKKQTRLQCGTLSGSEVLTLLLELSLVFIFILGTVLSEKLV